MSSVRKIGIGGAVGVAIGLIATGIQWKYPEYKGLANALLIMGGLILYTATVVWLVQALAAKGRGQQELSSPLPLSPPSQAVTQPVEQTLKQEGVVVAPHINVGPFNQNQEQSQSQSQGSAEMPSVLPLLECVEWDYVPGSLNNHGRLLDDEDTSGDPCMVAQAEFHLIPRANSDPWVELRTQLIFWADEATPRRLRRVKDAVWREQGQICRMPIDSGDTRTLVLALDFVDFQNVKGGLTTYEYRTHQKQIGLRESFLAPKREALKGNAVLVHVRLFGKYMSQLRLHQETWFRVSRTELSIEQIRPLSDLYTQDSE